MNPILLTLIISMAVQAFFFVFAASLKTDKVTDLSYGLTFIAITAYWLFKDMATAGQVFSPDYSANMRSQQSVGQQAPPQSVSQQSQSKFS